MDNIERFKQIVSDKIKRNGIDKLMQYLENETDFFTAPASSAYHNNFEGGLLAHSLNVYDQLYLSYERNDGKIKEMVNEESIAIVSLFHDICKANYYEVATRNVKKDNVWVQVPFYKHNEKFVFGHGMKSVFLIERSFKLKPEEAQAILAHIGGFDPDQKMISNIWNANPLALELAIADMRASFELEETRKE